MYIYQCKGWPTFVWDAQMIADLLARLRHKQGRLVGRMEGLGFRLQVEATLETITLDVLKSSEIEGEILNQDQVRSSVARRLGLDVAGLVPADRHVDGIVEMMMDATQHYAKPLDPERLFAWRASLFPAGRSGLRKIVVGTWRDNAKDDPMLVVSGPLGRQRVHFQAPDSNQLTTEMSAFLGWFNGELTMDPVLKAAIAHLWFVTIHPFDDGNGRIARAITDMQLARADGSSQRFYSMSAQIGLEKNYYDMLESTQKGTLDISGWLEWFFSCLDRSLDATEVTLADVLRKNRFWNKHANQPLNERQRLMINKLQDAFVGKLTSSKWAKIAKCSQDTAGRDINDLIDRGIMMKESAGGRSTNYVLVE